MVTKCNGEKQMNEEQKVETNTETEKKQTTEEWIQQELKEVEENSFDGERLPSFKPEENKTEDIVVDISSQWAKWIDRESGVVKKMIPVTHKGEEKLFWLNTANPCYRQLLQLANVAATKKETSFTAKILRTGQKQNTRYVLVE